MQKVNSKPFSSLIICKSSGASGGSAPWTPTRALPWTRWGAYSAPQTPSCLGNDRRSLRACHGHAPSASHEYFKPRNPPSNFLDPPLQVSFLTSQGVFYRRAEFYEFLRVFPKLTVVTLLGQTMEICWEKRTLSTKYTNGIKSRKKKLN